MAQDNFISTIGLTPTVYGAFVSIVRLNTRTMLARVRGYRARTESAQRVARAVDGAAQQEFSKLVPEPHGWIFVRWPDLAPGDVP